MIKKNLAIIVGVLALGTGTAIYVNDTQKENTTINTEVKAKQSSDKVALEKVKELNARVANGEEKLLLEAQFFQK